MRYKAPKRKSTKIVKWLGRCCISLGIGAENGKDELQESEKESDKHLLCLLL